MNKLLAIKEAAELLGVDPKTLRRWESDGKISPPSVTIEQRDERRKKEKNGDYSI